MGIKTFIYSKPAMFFMVGKNIFQRVERDVFNSRVDFLGIARQNYFADYNLGRRDFYDAVKPDFQFPNDVRFDVDEITVKNRKMYKITFMSSEWKENETNLEEMKYQVKVFWTKELFGKNTHD